MYMIGHASKKSENEDASSVADIIISFSGGGLFFLFFLLLLLLLLSLSSSFSSIFILRFSWIAFSVPNKKSVCNVLSCASSTKIAPYLDKSGSFNASLNNIPSVKNLILVCSLEQSSKRMPYPTKSPNFPPSPISWLTRFATDTAATRLGCVTATIVPFSFLGGKFDSNSVLLFLFSFFIVIIRSYTNCGICVVFPDPVSPRIITVSFCSMCATSSSLDA